VITVDYPKIDNFLFDQGMHVENYFIEKSPDAEIICYLNAEGRLFDLAITDSELANRALERLKQLGVRVIKLG
jgi:hypothetical protein